MLLHVASTPAGATVTVSVIFLLILAMSFAFGAVPEGGRRLSREWIRAWVVASAPRIAIAGAFSAVVLVAALSFGNSSTQAAINCRHSVAPLTGEAVTGDRISVAVASLNDMTAAANEGDTQRAQTVWLTSDAHNLTHDVDGPLRRTSEATARSLCEKVIALENVMVGKVVLAEVEAKAVAVAEALENARSLLTRGAP